MPETYSAQLPDGRVITKTFRDYRPVDKGLAAKKTKRRFARKAKSSAKQDKSA